MEKSNYPMPRRFCGAKTRQGGSCRQPAMKNGRCRLHGGKSLSGTAHGRFKHGLYEKGVLEDRRQLADLMRQSRALLKLI